MSGRNELQFIDVDPGTMVALEELARLEHEVAALAAQREQEEFAKHCREVNAIDGVGEVVRNVHSFAFHDWAAKLGSYDCWRDKGFNKYFDRIAPETRVRTVAPKSGNGLPLMVSVEWPGSGKRFSKNYGEIGSREEAKDAKSAAVLPSPLSPLPSAA